jgi:uncharacterized repeat protein (TIGR03943 family)
MKRAPTIIFLLGLAVFIIIRLSTGQINLYLRAPMTGILCFTVLFLFLMVWSYGMQPEASPHTDEIDGPHSHDAPGHKEEHSETNCKCGHDHEHRPDHDDATLACGCGQHATSWLQTCLMAVPFVIGLLLPPRPLGSAAMANRSMNRTSSGAARILPAARETRGEKNLYLWAAYINEHGDPASVSGQALRVTGFVYRDAKCVSNTFIIARFVMTCCAADASPVGFLVQWPEAASFNKDDWVTVTGHFGITTLDKNRIPVIQADAVQAVECPSRPYLSPWMP